MDISSKELCKSLITSRSQNPSWLLLAARRAPLIISCLKPLFESKHDGIDFEMAEQRLAETLAEHANNDEFEIKGDDYGNLARKDLRDWIKRGLVVEREGKLIATDALQQVLQFIDGLSERTMTSTASRLSTVQREIENLEMLLNSDPESRIQHLRRKIEALEAELAQVREGKIEILEGNRAIEGIRDIHNLAVSLRADFRRVEDSYREADRELRHSIISEHSHRGTIVDKLLDSHDSLLQTPEGQVFHGFHEQLNRSDELDNMKNRLRNILKNPIAEKALTYQQRSELRWLVARLVSESAGVIKARARSESDVKGFLKTGIANEQHRVGQILNELLEVALDIPWEVMSVRRGPATLPPVGISIAGVPLIERLRFKWLDDDSPASLELSGNSIDLSDIGNEFWEAFDTLDRQELIRKTIQLLTDTGKPMSIAELSRHLPPTHDLETLAVWYGMAREVEAPILADKENLDVIDKNEKKIRFSIPKTELSADPLKSVNWETL